MKKSEKMTKRRLIGNSAIVFAAIAMVLTGCGQKNSLQNEGGQEVAVQEGAEASKGDESKEQQEVISITPEAEQTEIEVKTANTTSSLNDYIKLLGLTKEELITVLEEEPGTIDEGGLEFQKAAIRIWFDSTSYTKAEQIFFTSPELEINGVKVGDAISRFEEVFGEPISDKDGDMHFKYGDAYISINYNTDTKDTYGIYLLKNDF